MIDSHLMKELVTTLTERGQVSIPAKIRRRLGMKPGARVCWQEVSDHECRLLVREEGPGAEAMRGYAADFRETRSTKEWMSKLREGEAD